MINCLKSIAAGAVAVIVAAPLAMADDVVAIFGKALYEGDVTDRIVFSEIKCDKRYDIEGICSFRFDNINTGHTTFVNNKFLHWYKYDRMAVEPEQDVAIDRMELYCTSADYCFKLTTSEGISTANSSIPVTMWNGTACQPFTLAADNGQIRVDYAVISYSVDQSSIDIVVGDSDEDAMAEYYTLQGVRVEAPTQSGVYICRKGSIVSKIVMP